MTDCRKAKTCIASTCHNCPDYEPPKAPVNWGMIFSLVFVVVVWWALMVWLLPIIKK